MAEFWPFKTKIWPKNGQILVLNGQNSAKSEYSRHIEYDFLKEDHKNNFHTKNQEDSQRRLEVKGQKPSKLSILAKNDQILATNGQVFAISEFSRHIHYEDHKGSFHTKNYESLKWRLEDIGQKHSKRAILAKKGQILTIFGHFGGQKIFRPKFPLVVI